MRLRQEGGAGHRPFAAALQDAAAASLLDLRFETFEQIAQAFIADVIALALDGFNRSVNLGSI